MFVFQKRGAKVSKAIEKTEDRIPMISLADKHLKVAK
jgi:hypothetical protein